MIGYPTKKNPSSKAIKQTTSKRGMSLEEDLNMTNQYYRAMDRAVIHKKPTPVQVVSVDYPMRSKARITEAYYRTPSTTEYNGVYRGIAIDFEAKDNQLKSNFPLSKIHSHQLAHLQQVAKHGAIAFVIVRFTTLDESYLIFIDQLMGFIHSHTRKSIPYAWFSEFAHRIDSGYTPPLDYLKVLDICCFKGEM